MKRFGYLRDPLCVAACLLYALNRGWLRAHVGGEFLTGYFNDLLFIPAALPLVLWLQKKLGVRADDGSPRWSEIGLHLVVWALVSEGLAPLVLAHATGDWRDVLAYTTGAFVAGLWWQQEASATV